MFESERKFSLHVYMCMCKNKMIVLKSRPLMWKAVKSKSTRTTEKSRALSRPHESHESVRSESVRILIVSIFMNCHKQKFSSKNSIDIGAEIRIDERFHFSFKYRIQIHIEIYIYTHYSCLPMLLPSLTATTLSKFINQNFPRVIFHNYNDSLGDVRVRFDWMTAVCFFFLSRTAFKRQIRNQHHRIEPKMKMA